MNKTFIAATLILTMLISVSLPVQNIIAQTISVKELAGLWEAKQRFGPDVRGELLIKQAGDWLAEISGRSAEVKITGDTVSFELPDDKGFFKGKFDLRRAKITGHWIQPATVANGTPYASPVVLAKDAAQSIWRGNVSPLDDEFTFYLMIKPREDGQMGAFLENLERNLGRFIRIDHVEHDGEKVKLFAADSANQKGRVLAEGKYNADDQVMSIYFSGRGGTFDFKRVGENQASDFYPRGRHGVKYTYAPPPAFKDGWPVASLEDVGMSRVEIEKFIQMIIDTPIDSVSSQEIHGVLIARHGKLVLEEYFHGENRDKPHDTRSAAKSLTATLFGAAVNAGVPIDISTPVYKVMNDGAFPPGLDARKKALTVENLLTMASGLDCDDSDPKSPGAEDYISDESGAKDYYKYTLDLKMIREPGEKAVYCSTQPNLVGGILRRASKQPLTDLFQNLLAAPLQIKKYYMPLAPPGDAYMGGGMRFLPRDFMKLAQLHLNNGVWNGRQILTAEWTQRATSHRIDMTHTTAYNRQTKQMETGTRKYGYFWWLEDYPYKGKTVRAYFAGGNGGQIAMAIPELDLVIAFYGGNYGDRAAFIPQWVYVPQYILPAISER